MKRTDDSRLNYINPKAISYHPRLLYWYDKLYENRPIKEESTVFDSDKRHWKVVGTPEHVELWAESIYKDL